MSENHNLINIFSRRTLEPEYLTVKEAAKELFLSTSTIYRRMKKLGLSYQSSRNGRMLLVMTRGQLMEIEAMSKHRDKEEKLQIELSPVIQFKQRDFATSFSTIEADEAITKNERLLELMKIKKRFRQSID